jgi:hypothetical protein
MERFETLGSFYRQYETPHGNILIEDVEKLEERLILSGYSVSEFKNGSVAVRSPSDIELAKAKKLASQKLAAARYTKLGAAIPRETARRFADACHALGVSQSEILLPLIELTISRVSSPQRNSGEL